VKGKAGRGTGIAVRMIMMKRKAGTEIEVIIWRKGQGKIP
jgi:hypothetical protein